MSKQLTVTKDNEQPPGGWKLTVRETGVTLTAPFVSLLKRKVAGHMEANNLALPENFDAWVEDTTCRESGHGAPFCGGAKVRGKRRAGTPKLLTVGAASRFIKTMLGVAKERKFVSREEAERRAAVCAKCPLATNVSGCTLCDAAFRKMGRLMEKNPIQAPAGKEFCGACKCMIPVKVWVPNATLDAAEADDVQLYHPDCWRHPSLEDAFEDI